MNTAPATPPLSIADIAQRILVARGKRVLLDADLAAFYGAATKRFNEQVKRNLARFPEDFMFQLNVDESAALRSQFATLKVGRGQHRKYLPYAFTEHGSIQAATIFNSARATEISVHNAMRLILKCCWHWSFQQRGVAISWLAFRPGKRTR